MRDGGKKPGDDSESAGVSKGRRLSVRAPARTNPGAPLAEPSQPPARSAPPGLRPPDASSPSSTPAPHAPPSRDAKRPTFSKKPNDDDVTRKR
jgi:hypothetical protein